MSVIILAALPTIYLQHQQHSTQNRCIAAASDAGHVLDRDLILESNGVFGVPSGSPEHVLVHGYTNSGSTAVNASEICRFIPFSTDLASDTGHILDGDVILEVYSLPATLFEFHKAPSVDGGTRMGSV